MEASIAQLTLGSPSNRYNTINISGNARAILGNVRGDHDFYRPGSNVDWKNTLRALYFEGMRTRKAQIDARASSPEYIQWIWNTNFAEWLNSEGSFFWITGQAGSGKSTLMKHIADSRKTKQRLQQNGEDWAVVHFFFDFRAGSATANNLEGLLRSLLYQLLKRCPDLARDMDLMSQEDFLDLSLTSCLDHICDAANTASFKVCAFIDGLDEFEGSGANLIEVVRSLEDRAGFKLCLASRPYRIFESSFSRYPNLTVQDFNGESINMYAQAQWDGKRLGTQPGLPRSFSDKILKKARGVFLWARLAIDELLQDLLRGMPISALEAQLEEMPKEVEAMYLRVLNRTPHIMLWEVAMLLHMIVCSNEPYISISNLYIALEAHVRRQSEEMTQARVLPIDLDDEDGLKARILDVLGDFIDVGFYNEELAFIDEDASPEDLDRIPTVVMYKGELSIRRGPSACVSLTHETLRGFLFRSIWLDEHIPAELNVENSRNLWLSIYLSELETAASHQGNSVDQLSQLKTSQFGNKIYRLLWEKAWEAIDAMDEDLVSILRLWPTWTPLLLLAVQNILRELTRSRPLGRATVQRVNMMLDSSVMNFHVAICLFQSCTPSAPALTDPRLPWLSAELLKQDLCIYSVPMRMSLDLDSIGWNGFYSICHGLPELCLSNPQLVKELIAEDKAQRLFDGIWRRAMTKMRFREPSGHTPYDSLMKHLIAHNGAQIGGPHICVLLRRRVIGPYFLLDLFAFVPNGTKLYHAQDCPLRGSEEQDSSFLRHWVDVFGLGGDWDPGLEKILDVLLRCGEQVNARYENQPLINLIIEGDGTGKLPSSRMRKTILALRAGADPNMIGRSGNALQTASMQSAMLEDMPKRKQGSALARDLLGSENDPDNKSQDVRNEICYIIEMLTKFKEQIGLTESQYSEYERFNCVGAIYFDASDPFQELDPDKLFGQ